MKPKRWGPGIVVRGKHHIALTPAGRAAGVYQLRENTASTVIGIVAGTVVKREVSDVATETRSARIFLPENVMVLSIERMPGKGQSSALVRVQHKYAVGEDPDLSRPVNVTLSSLGALFPQNVLAPSWQSNLVEVTLTANQNVATRRKRLRWRADGEEKKETGSTAGPDKFTRGTALLLKEGVIELQPLQIRAFQIPLRISEP